MLFRIRFLLAILLLAVSFAATADATATPPPLVSIIIDDLGDRLEHGMQVVELPGAVTCAILPGTPYGRRLADAAHRGGKEVMLHQPMESVEGKALGPGALTLDMTHEEFVHTLRANLAAIPHVRGVNNHMGSLLTRHPGHMAWLMDELQRHGGLYFIDSRTTRKSIAPLIAVEYGLPVANRNIFLDHHPDRAFIMAQFRRMMRQAHEAGTAIAIGHPYPETLAVLRHLLPELKANGIRLVPVSYLVAQRNKGRKQLWQASLSLSPKAAKNSKQ